MLEHNLSEYAMKRRNVDVEYVRSWNFMVDTKQKRFDLVRHFENENEDKMVWLHVMAIRNEKSENDEANGHKFALK